MFTFFAKAIKRLLGKSPVAAKLRTEHWAQVPLAIRERAFFSATVDDVRILQVLQSKLLETASN